MYIYCWSYDPFADLLSDSRASVAATHRHMTSGGHTHSCPHHNNKQSKGTRSKDWFKRMGSFYLSLSLSLSLSPARSDFLPVSQRPRHSPYPMLEVDKAIDLILSQSHRKSAKELPVGTSMQLLLHITMDTL